MKLLHTIVAVLTVLLLLFQKKFIFAGVCSVKKPCSESHMVYTSNNNLISRSFRSQSCRMCFGKFDILKQEDVSMPKCKKDPKISVDNEDIDVVPVE